MGEVLTIAFVEVAVALVSLAVAVAARVGLARRAGQGMPEGVLLDRSTWMLALLAFVPLSLVVLAVGPFGNEAGNDAADRVQPPPAATTATVATPAVTDLPAATTASTPTPPTPTPPTPKVDDAATSSAFASCTAGGALRSSVPGYTLKPVGANQATELRRAYPFATQVAARTVTDAGGTTVATIVALCPRTSAARANSVATRRLQRSTGERVDATTFTTGGETVQGSRTESSGSYIGTWTGRRTTYLVLDTFTYSVEPLLRAAVPKLRR